MASNVTLTALGLGTEPNQLTLPAGTLTEANNVIIKRDAVIESRRGYALYGNSLGSSSDTAKQLMTYKARILRHYSNVLQFDSDGAGNFLSFSGAFLEPQIGRKIRSLESNSNFYFTTADGIKKISAKVASDFTTASNYITDAGGIKALDIEAILDTPVNLQSGILPQDSAVAYRVVWGETDANNNLILGTPSERVEVFNPLLDLILEDFMVVLGALDYVSDSGGSLISDANYVSTLGLSISSTATSLFNNLISLSSKIDNDLLYADQVAVAPLQLSTATISGGVATITFSSGDPRNYLSIGSHIFLSGFSPTTGILNGAQTVATTTATTITFSTSATGPVTLSGSATIVSNEFRNIAQPSAPSISPTDLQLVGLQTYLNNIITELQLLPTTGSPASISSASKIAYINPLDIRTSADVILTISIPDRATTNTFFQIYRSDTVSATGSLTINDLSPSDELRLVFEGFPSATDISNGFVEVTDTTPDAFRGAFLYTNATTGQGILQANDVPPVALDIKQFKNVIFYANTRTKQRQSLNLLGIANMIDDFNNSITPTLTISNGITTNTYTFVTGIQEIRNITFGASDGATNTLVQSAATASYFLLNSANDSRKYFVWFSNGTTLIPTVTQIPDIAQRTEIKVLFNNVDTNTQVAVKTRDFVSVYNFDFSTSITSPLRTVLITNNDVGYTTDTTSSGTGLTVTTSVQGRGENVANKQILLSASVSPGEAVNETARSMVHIINENSNEIVYAFYLSGANDVPGQMSIEERNLSENPFYILGNNSNTGLSFNPDLSPSDTITSISVANPTVITTTNPHGLINLDKVMITNSNSTPSINGEYQITFISTTQFSINVNVTISGNRGSIKPVSSTVTSNNEVQPNRIYFSKLQQPEAVPLVNFIDIGAKDKQILRIFPLRDSLFIFKEDGLFRISGEVQPFNVALFDASCILKAADSLDISNNILHGWTTQGIAAITESGAQSPPISRPIDVDILKLASSQYTNFSTITWGMGYESDNSYIVYTNANITDTVPTIGYRYSTLTQSWTTFDKSATCGVINPADDKQYLGAGDVNFIEQERKNFSRTDYSDREYSKNLTSGNYLGDSLKFADFTHFAIGDVITQEQLLTPYQYNTLLEKLDMDPDLSPHNYFTSLQSIGGDDLRLKVDALINKIVADPGRNSQTSFSPSSSYTKYKAINGSFSINNIAAGNPSVITTTVPHNLTSGRVITITGSNSTPSIDGTYVISVLTSTTFTIPFSVTIPGTTASYSVNNNDFRDIEASYNGVISALNLDPGVAFSNYKPINTSTLLESSIIDINSVTKKITLDLTLDFVLGAITLFKSISSDFTYAPITMNDVLSLKHYSEATIMFENRAFKDAIIGFSSDLKPSFQQIPIIGTGTGIFGFDKFGTNFFGGGSNSAPVRTLIPRDLQRCRYLNVQFSHMGAREKYSIFGMTITGINTQSSRGYRL